MNHPHWNDWIRQTHRWLSIAFTLTVVANFVAMARGTPPAWVTYSPLLPLALLLFSGLVLFALPYLTKWRGRPSRSLSAASAAPASGAPGLRTPGARRG